MPLITGEITIERRVEEVFDFVSDERTEPRYNPQMTFIEQVSDGPIGVGSRFRAVVRSGGRPVPMEIEYTAFERPHRLGSRATMSGMVTDGELTFERAGESTLMRWSWDVQPEGALRLLAPLVKWIGVRQERRVWSGLKACMEAERPLSSSPWVPGSYNIAHHARSPMTQRRDIRLHNRVRQVIIKRCLHDRGGEC